MQLQSARLDVSQYHDNLIIACVVVMPSNCCKPKFPGWNEYVEENRRRKLFWHALRKDSGSPRTGCLSEIR